MPVVMHVRGGHVLGITSRVDDLRFDDPQLLGKQSKWKVGLDVTWSGNLFDQGYCIRDFQIGEKCIQPVKCEIRIICLKMYYSVIKLEKY